MSLRARSIMMLHDMAMQRGSRYIQARAQEAEEEARRRLQLKLAADEYRRKRAEAESGGWVEVKRESNATPSRERGGGLRGRGGRAGRRSRKRRGACGEGGQGGEEEGSVRGRDKDARVYCQALYRNKIASWWPLHSSALFPRHPAVPCTSMAPFPRLAVPLAPHLHQPRAAYTPHQAPASTVRTVALLPLPHTRPLPPFPSPFALKSDHLAPRVAGGAASAAPPPSPSYRSRAAGAPALGAASVCAACEPGSALTRRWTCHWTGRAGGCVHWGAG